MKLRELIEPVEQLNNAYLTESIEEYLGGVDEKLVIQAVIDKIFIVKDKKNHVLDSRCKVEQARNNQIKNYKKIKLVGSEVVEKLIEAFTKFIFSPNGGQLWWMLAKASLVDLAEKDKKPKGFFAKLIGSDNKGDNKTVDSLASKIADNISVKDIQDTFELYRDKGAWEMGIHISKELRKLNLNIYPDNVYGDSGGKSSSSGYSGGKSSSSGYSSSGYDGGGYSDIDHLTNAMIFNS